MYTQHAKASRVVQGRNFFIPATASCAGRLAVWTQSSDIAAALSRHASPGFPTLEEWLFTAFRAFKPDHEAAGIDPLGATPAATNRFSYVRARQGIKPQNYFCAAWDDATFAASCPGLPGVSVTAEPFIVRSLPNIIVMSSG